MNLDNVTVELRPRSEWEAVELGVRMINRDARAIYQVWFAVTLPLLAGACAVILFTPYPGLAPLLYWWLEPVADGPILRIISRRLFGESANVGSALRMTPALAWRNRLFLLTPWRFHFARSTAMPVTQLEGLTGVARRSRARVLNLKVFNYGTGVTAVYQHLVLALYMGIMLIGFALVPASYQSSVGMDWMSNFWSEEGRVGGLVTLGSIYLAQSALQPWFVGAGFGLYINCRTQLEAWDIEVAFRRMVQRRAATAATALVLLCFAVTAGFAPGMVRAQNSDPDSQSEYEDTGFAGYWAEDEFAEELQAVLASDPLRTEQEVEEWQRIQPDDPKRGPTSTRFDWLFKAMRTLGDIVAFIIEFGLWFAVGLLILLVFLTRDRWLPYLSGTGVRTKRRQTIVLADGELSADTLPEDVPAEVLRLWQAGDARRALSLMYRGSVFAAVTRLGVKLPDSATEGMCLKAVRAQTDTAHAAYFASVVNAWIRCAYGAAAVPGETVRALAQQWRTVYGAA